MSKKLGNLVKEARTAKGMTQAKLADKVGVSTEAVSKWEKGSFAPSPENAL